ncbi:GNAT family N-acetyltransferase [Kutzneria sp. CA-103260]|uniref:GNAT family N-acetyltransferase n=1 Tax=Kutzneria sp. CA-103260 TaxID=2802641 RepID=UPI001BAA713C|nr:GNAT family N-acetyltransferase [Kutzneria sp. CA-103260]
MAVEDVFTELPMLDTARMWLRRITESDSDGLFEIFSDDEVTRYYAFDTFTHIDQARDLAVRSVAQYQQGEAMRWRLLLAGAAQIIGTCGYTCWNREHHFAILGYDLARPYWGRGLMSEAAGAVVRLGFEQMALNRIEATVLVDNAASIRVLSRAGFQREGRLAERIWHRDVFHDVYLCGLTRSRWQA